MKPQADKRDRRPAPAAPRPIQSPAAEDAQDLLEGRNALREALRAQVPIHRILYARGEKSGSLPALLAQAQQAGVPAQEVPRQKLDSLSVSGAHQGVVAFLAPVPYVPVEELLARARARGRPPLLVACDHLTDPHNLGAILRSAEATGADGLLIPRHRSAGLSSTVAKTSAGAVYHLPVAQVANLGDCLLTLKKEGLWIFGAEADGTTPLYDADLTLPTVLVVGSEGEGLSRRVRGCCDSLLSIPLQGQVNSLNASAAAAMLLYEALCQRLTLSRKGQVTTP